MSQAQAILIWAIAFTAFERAYPPRDGDNRHPAEVLAAGLITVTDFLSYLAWKERS